MAVHRLAAGDEEAGHQTAPASLQGGGADRAGAAAQEASDDPPNWELITPGGVLLEFGPGVRRQISSATDPVSARR